jgi:hypothetical protein
MANISITIPDDQITRVVDAFCTLGNYDANQRGLTRNQFTKYMVIEYIKTVVKSTERATKEADAIAAIVYDSDVSPS